MRHVQLLVVAALVAAAVVVAQAAAASAGTALVTSADDAGAGSFRAAVAEANANAAVGQIVFAGDLAPVSLASTVVYTGDQSLRIVGNGATLDGDGFRAETAGDLSIVGLTVRDAPGEGIAYELAGAATGTREISLVGVTALDNDGYGVVIDDQVDPEDTSNPNGSAASLDVTVINATFDGNGFGALDRDGLRVNEGGEGSLHITIRNSVVSGNGADGIELDERAAGDVAFTVSNTHITGNGSFDLDNPDPDARDLDDGMDVDESGSGSLVGRIANSVASDNFEEGWDFNELNLGDLVVELTNVDASRNREEGIDLEEDDDFDGVGSWGGDLIATISGVTTDANCSDGGDGGLKVRERGDGDVWAHVARVGARENECDGVSVREQEAGSIGAQVERPTADGNTSDGVEFREQDAGDLVAATSNGSASANVAAGVRARESGTGGGSLLLDRVTLEANATPFVSEVPVAQS